MAGGLASAHTDHADAVAPRSGASCGTGAAAGSASFIGAIHSGPQQCAALKSCVQAALISIFLAAFWAAGVFGSVTVSTPFLKLASTLSASIPSGIWKERSKEPK
jgi:hypothetical protein